MCDSRDLRVVSLSTLGSSLKDVFREITGRRVGAVRHDAPEGEAGGRGKAPDGGAGCRTALPG